MKLEFNQLAPYLPYNLKVIDTSQDHIFDLSEWLFRPSQKVRPYYDNHLDQILSDRSLRIILRNISDLTKEEAVRMFKNVHGSRDDISANLNSKKLTVHWSNDDGNSGMMRVKDKMGRLCNLSLREWEWLFKNHYDIYGLIESGLAVDINTLKS